MYTKIGVSTKVAVTPALLIISLACGAASMQAQSRRASARVFIRAAGVSGRHSVARPETNPPTPDLNAGGLSTFSFGMIDYPKQLYSVANGINDFGEVVGGYGADLAVDGIGDHGFLLKGNTFIKIDYPGAAWSEADAINNSGEIVGSYGASMNDSHGYTRIGNVYTSFDYPGSTGGTVPLAINKSGVIVGYRFDTPSSMYGRPFMLANGIYTSIDFPGSLGGTARAINSAGEIVGSYFDGTFVHGFTLVNGVFTTMDMPGHTQTELDGINDNGVIVGSYGDAQVYPLQHGFVYANGVFTTMDVPFGPPAYSGPTAVNNKNVAVGGYVDNSGASYGYQVVMTP